MVSLGSAILRSAPENLPLQTSHPNRPLSVVRAFFSWDNRLRDYFGVQRRLQVGEGLFVHRFSQIQNALKDLARGQLVAYNPGGKESC